MSEVEVDGVSREKPAHERGEEGVTRPKKKMKVVGHKRPGQALGTGLTKKLGEVFYKAVPVAIIAKNVTSLHATNHDVLKKTGSI